MQQVLVTIRYGVFCIFILGALYLLLPPFAEQVVRAMQVVAMDAYDMDSTAAITAANAAVLEREVQRVVDQHIDSDTVHHVSVYLHDLSSGVKVEVDEKRLYDPASLLKVPLLLVYLQLVDQGIVSLEHTLQYQGVFDHEKNIPPTLSLIGEQQYSVYELLYKMVVYSDNLSRSMLAQYLATVVTQEHASVLQDEMNKVLPVQQDASGAIFVTPVSYAGLFEYLYAATVLSPEMSVLAQQMLSESTFHEGIVAGVTPGVRVAHKYGYGGNIYDEHDHQVHDCGIVYAAMNEYVLCVFTQTDSEQASHAVIQSISRVVFDGVSRY